MTFIILSIIPAVTMILWIFSIFLIIYAGYYFIISLFTFKPVEPLALFPPQKKFAVLIAARNEARVIGNLIYTLNNQDYPSELFEIFVIPNRCVDHTSTAALEAGAAVLECPPSVNSKGQVLSCAFGHLLKTRKDFDAFCVFDADNLADPGFLKAMNDVRFSAFNTVFFRRRS